MTDPIIPVAALKGVGPRVAELLSQLSIVTIQDLLFHLPARYEDRTTLYPIASLKIGDRVLIEGTLTAIQISGARGNLRCVLEDDSGARIDLVFYYLVKPHQQKLSKISSVIRCFGEVRRAWKGGLEIIHPEYAPLHEVNSTNGLSLSPCLLPVYSLVKGLQQGVLRKLMRQALDMMQHSVLAELLPRDIVHQFHFSELKDALLYIHFPPRDANITELFDKKHPAQQRLIFEELLANQLTLHELRQGIRKHPAIALPQSPSLADQFLQQLPFQLTDAQQRVITEINDDLNKTSPMLRLLQGDVGSGKTVVACLCALQVIAENYQVAFMAPTEILCQQQYQHFSRWLNPLGISVAFLSGRQSASEQKTIKENLRNGKTQLIVGTHALFQADVDFHHCALLIIDEQHRFGVHQRLTLMEKCLKAGVFPHQLMMTATPIPRTLTMSAYADLDISVIDELPPGRKPITTTVTSSIKRDDIIERVRVNCEQKKQAYWICTLIDESDVLECQAAETSVLYLRQQLPTLTVALIHGRLSPLEKNLIMDDFIAGKTDLLVATTVIEVGVDVANASLMIIENPERLGLAQLHQLRGRVGRGDIASYCVLLYQSPLSQTAQQRLSIMRETQDGFLIAEHDLKIRGPGEVLGVRQSGLPQLQVADLLRDHHLLPFAQRMSLEILEKNPELVSLLKKRWIKNKVHYIYA